MIIVSQNRERFLNFDNIARIEYEKCNGENYIVYDLTNGNFGSLGIYPTEERGKEVLEEIAETYIGVRAIENCEADLNFNENTQMRIRPKMYYMPEV